MTGPGNPSIQWMHFATPLKHSRIKAILTRLRWRVKPFPLSENFERHLATQAFQQARDRVTQEAVSTNPDIANPQTPIYREMAEIYDTEAKRARDQNRRPLFELIPDFLPLAAEVGKLRLEAKGGAEWKTKYEQLLTRFEEQNKLLSVNGSSPVTPRAPKTFEQMTHGSTTRRAGSGGRLYSVHQMNLHVGNSTKLNDFEEGHWQTLNRYCCQTE